jgi:type I restriction enzyme, S subunit
VTFPRYPEYKDSGVEWLGEVPAHWNISPIKRFVIANDGGVWGDEPSGETGTPVLRSTEQTVDGRWKMETPALRQLSKKEAASAKLNEGDLVVTKSSGSSAHIGKTTLVSREIAEGGFCYSNFMQRLRFSSSFLPKIVWYLMNNELVRFQFDNLSNTTTGLANLNGEIIGNVVVPVAPIAEQSSIAAFLDYETARIDALVEEQKRLIELLKEKRQAVISHAVTKGLDPNVPMKDSGVEWLGEVPAHWEVGKLRWFAQIQGGVAKGKDYSGKDTIMLPYLRVANVQDGYVDLSEVKEITVQAEEAERYSLRKGDVLMNEGGDNDKLGRGTVWQGQISPCLHQNHVFAIRPDARLNPEWLAMFTQSNSARDYFFINSKQSTNLASISSSNVMNCPVPLPPLHEQQQVLAQTQEKADRLDGLINAAIQGIELLQERRSALISAAVTGKIDVRGWKPPATSQATAENAREPA